MARARPIKRSAGLLFVSDGRILLLERSASSNNAGLWGLPGGQRDDGETAAEAAWREACEELGHVPPAHVIGRMRVERGAGSKRYDIYVCDAGSRARRRFAPRLNEEHECARWVSMKWCRKHADRLHPVVAELIASHTVSRALERSLAGRAAFDRKVARAPRKGVRVVLRPAA